jgi:hypothetical protein
MRTLRNGNQCHFIVTTPAFRRVPTSLSPDSSHLGNHAGTGAEGMGFDPHLLDHADEEVREKQVVASVVGQVALVLEAAAGQQDGEVVVVVRG